MLECTEGLGEIQGPAAGQRIVRLATQRPTRRRPITSPTAANLEEVVHSRTPCVPGKEDTMEALTTDRNRTSARRSRESCCVGSWDLESFFTSS